MKQQQEFRRGFQVHFFIMGISRSSASPRSSSRSASSEVEPHSLSEAGEGSIPEAPG
jgi:hypothetical protein